LASELLIRNLAYAVLLVKQILALWHTSSRRTLKLDKVIIRLEEKSKSPAIGIVRTIQETGFVVQTGDLILTVPQSQIAGKLLGVFPFIGSIFTILGM